MADNGLTFKIPSALDDDLKKLVTPGYGLVGPGGQPFFGPPPPAEASPSGASLQQPLSVAPSFGAMPGPALPSGSTWSRTAGSALGPAIVGPGLLGRVPTDQGQPALPRTGMGELKHILGKIGTAAALTVNPSLAPQIPGTRAFKEREEGLAEHRAAEQAGLEKVQAETKDIQAQEAERERAVPKEQRPPTVESGGQAYQLNPETGKYDIPIGNPKPDVAAAAEQRQQERLDAQEQRAEKAAAESEKKQAAQFAEEEKLARMREANKSESGSFMPMIDPKTGAVTGAWDPKSGRTVAAPAMAGTTAAGAGVAGKAAAANQKQVQSLQAIADTAELGHELAAKGNAGNAEADADLALEFFKTMRSAQTGSSGIRFTKQEQDLIMKSRPLLGDLQAGYQKIAGGGQKLTEKQREQIVEIMDMHAKAAQKQIDKLGGAAEVGGSAPVGSDEHVQQWLANRKAK